MVLPHGIPPGPFPGTCAHMAYVPRSEMAFPGDLQHDFRDHQKDRQLHTIAGWAGLAAAIYLQAAQITGNTNDPIADCFEADDNFDARTLMNAHTHMANHWRAHWLGRCLSGTHLVVEPPFKCVPIYTYKELHDAFTTWLDAETRSWSRRNIVAHIDHGKSTLADRLIQSTGTVAARHEGADARLDGYRAGTRHHHQGQHGPAELPRQGRQDYILNLIDTPGHVDFAYEVSRSMRAVEGSLLVVDASQGRRGADLANVYQALDAGHDIVPVLNKIDLPAAEPDRVKAQIEDVIGLDASDAVADLAKSGLGIPDVLEAIVTRLPAPKGDRDRAL